MTTVANPLTVDGELPGVDRESFFNIMSSFASGVAVVTTLGEDGQPKGLTSSAVCSVSVTPPLLLACVDRTSRTLPALLHRGEWVVNILAGHRHALSTLFAGKDDDKFRDVVWRTTESGLPLLHKDTVSHAVCRTTAIHEAGDHLVLIGRVIGGGVTGNDELDFPLVYFRRQYHVVQPAIG